MLHNSLTETIVFSRQQLLRQLVPGAVGIARGAGKMMVDSHFGGATEITRNRKDFIGRLTGVDLVLCEGTRRANREKFRRDPNETRKQQLLAIEFRTKARHGVKQSARQSPACARGVANVRPQIGVKFV